MARCNPNSPKIPLSRWIPLPILLTAALIGIAARIQGLPASGKPAKSLEGNAALGPAPTGLAYATFAGGCFWCMESPYLKLKGVVDVLPGYSGGDYPNPTYEDVSTGTTGHAESVNITYDPKQVSYATLVEAYWRAADPTDAGGQFADRGSQYRPAIFYRNGEQKKLAEASKSRLAASGKFQRPIAVEITAFKSFYLAEEEHRHYAKRNPARYKAYSIGSGREGFLKKNFGIEAPPEAVIPVNKDNDGVEE